MRYPGYSRQEHRWRWLLTLLAVVFFAFGLTQVSADTILKPPPKGIRPNLKRSNPTPTPVAATATLILADANTGQPLVGQSVAIILSADCSANSPCPAASPRVVTTDEQGRVVVERAWLKAKPKIYATGYRLDSYFAFLDAQMPDMLTLYRPYGGAKLTYNIETEEVPVWLAPAP